LKKIFQKERKAGNVSDEASLLVVVVALVVVVGS